MDEFFVYYWEIKKPFAYFGSGVCHGLELYKWLKNHTNVTNKLIPGLNNDNFDYEVSMKSTFDFLLTQYKAGEKNHIKSKIKYVLWYVATMSLTAANVLNTWLVLIKKCVFNTKCHLNEKTVWEKNIFFGTFFLFWAYSRGQIRVDTFIFYYYIINKSLFTLLSIKIDKHKPMNWKLIP